METINVFKTKDGQLFETLMEAEHHEMFLINDDTIVRFINSDFNPYQSGPTRSIVKNSVVNWELFKSKEPK